MKNKFLLLIVTITLVNTWFALTRLSNAQPGSNPGRPSNVCDTIPLTQINQLKLKNDTTDVTLSLRGVKSKTSERIERIEPKKEYNLSLTDFQVIIISKDVSDENLSCRWSQDQTNTITITFETNDSSENKNSYTIFRETQTTLKVASSSN